LGTGTGLYTPFEDHSARPAQAEIWKTPNFSPRGVTQEAKRPKAQSTRGPHKGTKGNKDTRGKMGQKSQEGQRAQEATEAYKRTERTEKRGNQKGTGGEKNRLRGEFI